MRPQDLNYGEFFGAGVLAATSDTGFDFHQPDRRNTGSFSLTPSQQAWLLGLGVDTPDKIVFPQQVHGDGIWVADEKSSQERGTFQADAVVTDQRGLPIAVRTADCGAILIFSPEKKAVAAVHAGWKSTRLNIAHKTVDTLQSLYGVEPRNLRVVFGPCIRMPSYRVGEEFKGFFPDDVQELDGRLHFDLAGANRRQLLSAGVLSENIHDCGLDTVTRKELHSFRRDGERAGRMINVIMMT
jgi:YfiH family protein